MQELILAGEGKGGGGGHTPVELDDTLRSKQTLRLLFAVSEGEIDSVEDIYLNKVSISKYTGTWGWKPGTANQEVIPGFINVESPQSQASVEITQANPFTLSVPSDVDAVRFTLVTPVLRALQENKDLGGASIKLKIYTRPTDDIGGPSFTFIRNANKSGKASNPYAWDILVERPADVIPGDFWQIRITRNNAVLSGTAGSNSCNIAGVTHIWYKQLNYPRTALIWAILTDADEFGSSIPDVVFKGRWIKVKIPSNYTPWVVGSSTPASYSGTWDLTFTATEHWTSNIAWVIFDVLTNQYRGLEIPVPDVDKVSFYELSLVADQLISDGKGGWCPRYSIGNQYYTRETAVKTLSEMLALCNAQFGQNEFGQLSIIFDNPNMQVSKIVTNANVIEGLFNYSSSDMENRTTQVNVTYNNRLNFSETDTVTVPDNSPITFEQEMQARYGYVPTDIPLPGCTYEAQAIQKARHTFYTNCVNTKIISFQVMMTGLTYSMGEIISIMDSENAQKMQHAIIKTSTFISGNTVITLDREIEIDNLVISKLQYYGTDAVTVLLRNVTEQNTTTDTVTLAGDYPAFIGSPAILYGTVQPQLMRVAAIEKEDEFYAISCIEYDPNKWSYIDSEIIIGTGSGSFVNLTDFTADPVTNLTVTPRAYTSGLQSGVYLDVFWDWSSASDVKATFQAAWRRDNRDYTVIKDIEATSFDIPDALAGVYEITVWAVHPSSGVRSTPTVITYSYKVTSGLSELVPPTNVRIKGTAGTTYTTQDMTLVWDFNTANQAEGIADALKDYVVELWLVGGSTAITSYDVPADSNLNGEFILTFASNVAVFGTPTRQYQVKIYSRDLSGDLSNAVAVTVNNPAPTVSAFTVTGAFNSISVDITPVNDLDLKYYRVYRSTAPTGGSTVLLAEGNTTYFNIETAAGIEYWYSVSAIDSFGTSGEVITTRQSATAISTEANTYTFADLTFTPNSPATNYVSWSSFQVSKNGNTPFTVLAGNAGWTSGILYLYYLDDDNTLNTTTSLSVAVQGRIVGSYHGGTNIVADEGRAYMDGDMIIAGTVGANQLFAGEIITQAAQIGDILESDNFNWAVPYTGWRLDKSGTLRASAVEIRNSAGSLVFSTGRGISGNFIDISPSGNMFPNSDFSSPTHNWVIRWNQNGGTDYNFTRDLAHPDWSPAGSHNIGIVRGSIGDTQNYTFDIEYNQFFAVGEGQRIEISAYLASHRCPRYLMVYYYNANQTYVGDNWGYSVAGDIWTPQGTSDNGGQNLANWDRVGGFLTMPTTANSSIPSNVRYIRIGLRSGPTTSSNPYAWITKIFLGIPNSGQTQLSPWSAATSSGAFAETSQLTNSNSTSLIAGDNGYLLNSLQQWNQVSGTGRPEDNATVNIVFRQATQPTQRPNGSPLATNDFWFDTTTLNPRTYSYNGSSWVLQGDITANNTAAALAGQGAFATISQILKAKATTYIEAGAIGSLQVDTAAIGDAHIDRASVNKLVVVTADMQDLSVQTLKIAGSAVTVPLAKYTAASTNVNGGAGYIQVLQMNTGVISHEVETKLIISFGGALQISVATAQQATVTARLQINGVTVYSATAIMIDGTYVMVSGGSFSASVIYTLPISADYSINFHLSCSAGGSASSSISNKFFSIIAAKR
jgi:predicted phage tail protein